MAADPIAISVMTVFWGIVGIVMPFILGKGPNKGVIQVVLVIGAASCWLFWLLCYLHQLNPLIGPSLRATSLLAVQYLWDGNDVVNYIPTANITDSTTTMKPY